jgi:ABC-type branched-subunit amino acid transport system substrate-binding protein
VDQAHAVGASGHSQVQESGQAIIAEVAADIARRMPRRREHGGGLARSGPHRVFCRIDPAQESQAPIVRKIHPGITPSIFRKNRTRGGDAFHPERNTMKKTLPTLFAALLCGPVLAEDIVVGQSIDLSGSSAAHGNAVVAGIELFMSANKTAFGKYRLVIKRVDDGGDAKRAADNARNFIEKEKVVALFAGIEGGPCVAQLKVATELKVPLVGCMSGAPDLRTPFNRYSLPVRAEHYREFEQLLLYAQRNGMKKLAFLHADNANGLAHLNNINKLTRQYGIPDVVPVPLKAGADGKPDAKALADQIARSGANAMFNHGAYTLFADVVGYLRAANVAIQFLAINSGAQQMVERLGDGGKGIVFTQVVPFPYTDKTPLAHEYRKALFAQSAGAQPSFSGLEGYMTAKVFAEAVKRLPRASPEAIIGAFESMGSVDVGGVIVRYKPGAHIGSEFVDTVIAGSGGRFRN